MALALIEKTEYQQIPNNFNKHKKIITFENGVVSELEETHNFQHVSGAPSNITKCSLCGLTVDSSIVPPVSDIIEESSEGITIAFLNAAPFNEQSKIVRDEVRFGTSVKKIPEDMKRDKINNATYPKGLENSPVIGTWLTSTNLYYNAFKNGGAKAAINGATHYNSDMWNSSHYNNNGKDFARWIHNTLAWNNVLPNCVGGARGRYQELVPMVGSSKSFPDRSPQNIIGDNTERTKALSHHPVLDHKPKPNEKVGGITVSGADDYIKAAENFWIWQDKSGKYGPTNGIWGYAWAIDGFPPLPGCMIAWKKKSENVGHIEFVDAVYKFGEKDCYVYTHASAYGHFDEYVLRMGKRTKNITFGNGNSNAWGYRDVYNNTRFFYTPLCNFDNVSLTDGGSIFNSITLNYNDPSAEQQEAYNEIRDYLSGNKKNLVVGQKVKITNLGNQKPNGLGKKVNRINGEGTIRKIADSGMSNPFLVVDKNNSTIGYFDKYSIKVI